MPFLLPKELDALAARSTFPHSTTGAHASAHGRRCIGQLNAACLGPFLHLLVMFIANLLTLLLGFGITQLVAVNIPLLAGHQLATVDLLLRTHLGLGARQSLRLGLRLSLCLRCICPSHACRT